MLTSIVHIMRVYDCLLQTEVNAIWQHTSTLMDY